MLILPASIQFVHAFEQHEEIICSEDVEHHFHQDTIECFLCHLQAENHLATFSDNYEVVPTLFYVEFTTDKPAKVFPVYLSKKSSRAPPSITV